MRAAMAVPGRLAVPAVPADWQSARLVSAVSAVSAAMAVTASPALRVGSAVTAALEVRAGRQLATAATAERLAQAGPAAPDRVVLTAAMAARAGPAMSARPAVRAARAVRVVLAVQVPAAGPGVSAAPLVLPRTAKPEPLVPTERVVVAAQLGVTGPPGPLARRAQAARPRCMTKMVCWRSETVVPARARVVPAVTVAGCTATAAVGLPVERVRPAAWAVTLA